MRPLDAAPSRCLHATTSTILDAILSDAESGDPAYITQTLGRETAILRVDPQLRVIQPVARISWPSGKGGDPAVEVAEVDGRRKILGFRGVVPRVLVAPWTHTKPRFGASDTYQRIFFDQHYDVVATSHVSVRRPLFGPRREWEIVIRFMPEATFRDDMDVLIAAVLLASEPGEWKKARSQSTMSLAQLQQAVSLARLDFHREEEYEDKQENDVLPATLW
ncbi:hypothetical protein BS47DRAFT_1485169 [Hydnum rufescens UP504]|uniref:Uncharacterized protein n=1 Tax=Hydnum rufescens UP504 TaxID=1448309 RepID=A0A9P6DWZ5_9AGAM|nr:hypothetical protein BS47DRAFT_1485169 [Hydnum rufescens UP504]